MRKNLILRAVVACFFFAGVRSEQALAQVCDTGALGTCLSNSGAICRNALSGCGVDFSAGLSVPDVQDLAVSQCCAFGTVRRQRRCFTGIITRLTRARRTRSIVSPFLSRARTGVAAVRAAGCGTGSLP